MLSRIEKKISNIVSVLSNTALTKFEMFDVLITLILWRFIVDTDNYIEIQVRMNSGRLWNDINNDIRHFLKKKHTYLEKSKLFSDNTHTVLSKEKTLEVLNELEDFFKSDWIWSEDNIFKLFDVLESALVDNIQDAHLHFTPIEMIKLLPSLVDLERASNVYDPFCRTGGFLFEAARMHNKSQTVTGRSKYVFSLKIAQAKQILTGITECDLELGDIYSTKNCEKFDCIITNPPFGGAGNKNHLNRDGEWTSMFMGISTELDYLCHVLDNLNDFGQAAIIVPIGLLFKEGKVKAFRQKMIEGNILQGIVELPLGIFYGTNVKTAILIINKSKKISSSLLVNATMLGNKTKDRCLLSEGDVSYIIELFTAYTNGIETNSDNSLVVTNDMFVQNDYDFQFHKYRPNNAPKSKKRNSHEILAEIQNLKELYALSYNDMLQLINTKPSD